MTMQRIDFIFMNNFMIKMHRNKKNHIQMKYESVEVLLHVL